MYLTLDCHLLSLLLPFPLTSSPPLSLSLFSSPLLLSSLQLLSTLPQTWLSEMLTGNQSPEKGGGSCRFSEPGTCLPGLGAGHMRMAENGRSWPHEPPIHEHPQTWPSSRLPLSWAHRIRSLGQVLFMQGFQPGGL